MPEQMIRVVETENTVDGTVLRFGPLGNKSHRKAIVDRIPKEADSEWGKQEYDVENPLDLSHRDIEEIIYNRYFPTLEQLNLEGWKLESFSLIRDSSLLEMQVAIFTRE